MKEWLDQALVVKNAIGDTPFVAQMAHSFAASSILWQAPKLGLQNAANLYHVKPDLIFEEQFLR